MSKAVYHGPSTKITVHSDSNEVIVEALYGQYTTTVQDAVNCGRIPHENGTYFFSKYQRDWLKKVSQ